ncbi:transmembrane emp24 domain-containing protein 3-like [Cariama cristata]
MVHRRPPSTPTCTAPASARHRPAVGSAPHPTLGRDCGLDECRSCRQAQPNPPHGAGRTEETRPLALCRCLGERFGSAAYPRKRRRCRCRARATSGGAGRVGSGAAGMRAGVRAGMRGLAVLVLLGGLGAGGTELTFELPDSAQQCFHQELERGLKFALDYQVISGGHYDVDCHVEDPNGRTIYKETKKQYDSFPHRTEVKGVYTFCFSNEFSTFSHKTIYFDFQVGDEPPILPEMSNRVTALTQMESACVTIHEALNTVIDSQTHYRLREAQDRSRAEDLNGRVSYWSVGETLILFVVSIGQVMLLKSFFTEKRPGSGGAGT